MFDGASIPSGFFTRMIMSMLTSMRKVQDSMMSDLHRLRANDKIKRFILPYLGQLDNNLPFYWPDLIKREEVKYPTDFNPMDYKQIEKLAKRGEQLTKLLINLYIPEL